MATLYVTQQGAVVSKTSERLKVTLDEEVLSEIPIRQVSQVVICGHVLVTPPALSLVLQEGIEICYVTTHGRYVGRTVPAGGSQSRLRLAQYRAALEPARGLELARACVGGKLANLRLRILDRIEPSRRDRQTTLALNQLKDAEQGAGQATDLGVLRAYEGSGSAAYFSVFQQMLKTEVFRFEKRIRRPPTDPGNVLLSFGYTLLTNEMCSAVNVVGLDPYLGYLHAQEDDRPALPLDLIEEFRPLIVDAVVLTCANRALLTPADFQATDAGLRLSDAGRRVFFTQYEQRKSTEFLHPTLRQTMTYQQSLEQQARLFARALREELPAYPPLVLD